MRISESGSRRRPRVSQADIAARAGLTQAAVSLILRGKAKGIPQETCDRVKAIAQELGYHADPLARRLANGRSQLLGVFTYERSFPVDRRNFAYPFLLGIEEAAEEHEQDLLLFTSAGSGTRKRSIYGGGENKLRLVDAAVLLGREGETDELDQLVADEYPFVFIGRRRLHDGREVPSVSPAYERATAELVATMAKARHRRILYLGENETLLATADRRAGFGRAGVSIDERYLAATDVSPSTLSEAMAAGTTAIIAESSTYAEAIVAAANDLGVAVPSDLSVVVAGLVEIADDDAGWSGYAIPGRRIGALAVADVLALIEGGERRQRVVMCEPVLGSTLGTRPKMR